MLSHEKVFTGKYLDRELECSYNSLADFGSFTEFTYLKYTEMPLTTRHYERGMCILGEVVHELPLAAGWRITDGKSHTLCRGTTGWVY